ncbi:MAG: virulence protein SciE type [Sphingobacteriia bacterium]|nr:virulence protein SciE type [Sphingobacteriia bacterium]NCC39865.1 virulence protein SciE type [Gammaproteobacteria bacterium]
MRAEEALRQGDLDESLRQLQEQVRREPANAKYRIFLFQLLALMGHWGRSLNQLEVAGELDAGALAMVQTYREALRCEVLRAEIFAGQRSPLVFGQPEEWLALLIEAQRLAARGVEGAAQVRSLRERALAAAPATPGRIDETPFDWIMDGDGRLGPVLEAIVNGRYYWVPFQHLRAIAIDQPEDLRDLVWLPAHFTWANGGESVGLIPTRYPDSADSNDPELRASRRTEWIEQPDGTFVGLGQRMFFTDRGEYPLMDVRAILLETAGDETAAEPGEDATLG